MKEKYKEEMLMREKWLKQQLQDNEDSLMEQLTEMVQQWMARAQEMGLKHKELEQQLQERMKMREEQEKNRREDIQRLSQQLSHLQVRYFNLCSCFNRFQIVSDI